MLLHSCSMHCLLLDIQPLLLLTMIKNHFLFFATLSAATKYFDIRTLQCHLGHHCQYFAAGSDDDV